jgi:hypothetical protein
MTDNKPTDYDAEFLWPSEVNSFLFSSCLLVLTKTLDKITLGV